MVIKSNKRDFKANKLKIGTRGSPLALAQALEVIKEIINAEIKLSKIPQKAE